MKTKILALIWVSTLLLCAGVANAASRFEIKQLVIEEASKSRVPVELALAVAKVESDFNPKALSSAGARGVMQIMPETAKGEFGVSPNRLWDASTNVRLGVRFLEKLHSQYDGRWDLALSHYNGGTIKGNRPHKFTLAYVQKVQKWQKIYEEQAELWKSEDDKDTYLAEREITDEPFETVELREWQPTQSRYDRIEDFYNDDEPVYNRENYNQTRIIIVERGEQDYHRVARFDRRPPPPPPHHHRPPPRHGYFR